MLASSPCLLGFKGLQYPSGLSGRSKTTAPILSLTHNDVNYGDHKQEPLSCVGSGSFQSVGLFWPLIITGSPITHSNLWIMEKKPNIC